MKIASRKFREKGKYILLLRGLILVVEVCWSSGGATQGLIEGKWKQPTETIIYPPNFTDIGGYEER